MTKEDGSGGENDDATFTNRAGRIAIAHYELIGSSHGNEH